MHFSKRQQAALRMHLRHARAPLLPTVWSNCIAAWGLSAGVFLPTLAVVMLGFSLFFIGGMYLVSLYAPSEEDREWGDYEMRERPGEIQAHLLAFGLMGVGLFWIWGEGWATLGLGILMTVVLVAHALTQERRGWSPLLMAGFRALIYLTVAVAATTGINLNLFAWAIALAAYLAGALYVTAPRATHPLKRWAPGIFLFSPALLVSWPEFTEVQVLYAVMFLIWVGYALFRLIRVSRGSLLEAQTRLLAGISLVDLLALSNVEGSGGMQLLCLLFWGTTFLMRKYLYFGDRDRA